MITDNNDLSKAKSLLKGSTTCVLVKGSEVLSSTQRGIKPLLQWLDSGKDLSGFSAADKVVGKAAAFLYILLGVDAVHACVISEPSSALLREHRIAVSSDETVPAIRNRTDTGFCPMEQATKHISEPTEALAAVRETLKRLGS